MIKLEIEFKFHLPSEKDYGKNILVVSTYPYVDSEKFNITTGLIDDKGKISDEEFTDITRYVICWAILPIPNLIFNKK
jgi:hypothetical protein